ncbi:MAG TPA: energy-coupling factor transporter transmembrane component T [Clostridia bacterium]|nr:energy-coupling factor transporter transmembrane component T [Clostridia bacterium]
MGIHNRMISPFYISHPFTLFMYYTALFSCIFIFKNPFFMLSLFTACCLMAMCYSGMDKFLKSMKWIVLIGAAVLALNILLVHKGSSVMFYLFKNPITKEALIYGLYNMLMLMSVMTAFISFNTLLDSSKFLYLFSNILPKTSFVFDMALRYIPLFKKRASDLAAVQSVNSEKVNKSVREKIQTYGIYLKALTSWTLEEGMDTALSLKVKNYGTFNKVHYARYRYTLRDILLLSVFMAFTLFIYIAAILGNTGFTYYPVTSSVGLKDFNLVLYGVTVLVIYLPFINEGIASLKRGFVKLWLQKR